MIKYQFRVHVEDGYDHAWNLSHRELPVEWWLRQYICSNPYLVWNQTSHQGVFHERVTQRTGNTSMVSVSNSENVDEFTHQLEKFKKEARRLFELDNNNIVKVHDLFEENGTAYYVMDYIDGEDLRQWLEREKRPMTEDEVMIILLQVLNALSPTSTVANCYLAVL